MSLYNLRSTPHGYQITKFDSDFNVESSYTLSHDFKTCDCPAGQRPFCRHRKMGPLLKPNVDTEMFYDYDNNRWHEVKFDEELASLVVPSDALPKDVQVEVKLVEDKPWRRPI